VLSLPVTGVSGLGDVLEAHPPTFVIIAGANVPDDHVARWAYQARSASGPLPVMLFRRPAPSGSVRATARALPEGPFEAHRVALGVLEETPGQKENRFQSGARRVSAARRRVGT
jgi:hypothetical protein